MENETNEGQQADKEEKPEVKPEAAARPPLPPPSSAAKPVGGARPPLPPPSSAARPVGAARPPLPPPSSAAKPVGAARPPLPPPTSAANPAGAAAKPLPPPGIPKPAAAVQATHVASVAAKAPGAPEIRKPKQDKPPENDQGIWRMSRKNFLNVAGWLAFFSFLVTATIGAIRLMVPRVLYEAPSAFKAGYPQDYIVGEVNEKYKDEFRVWIVREQEGLYALAAICTHLGCTPRWLSSDDKFKCPCHGSGYHKDGVNFEGPTPRPLERLKITLADDGQIVIDRNIKFLYEKQEWSKPDAFLKYSS